jgi:hypothetical protein
MFQISNFQEFFTTCKWGVIYMTYKIKLFFINKKLKPKLIFIFWYDMFSRWNTKFAHFEKFNTKYYEIVDVFQE